MKRYEQIVQTAQKDSSGEFTQAKTVQGYLLERANMSDEDITVELRQAASDYGTKEWYQLP